MPRRFAVAYRPTPWSLLAQGEAPASSWMLRSRRVGRSERRDTHQRLDGTTSIHRRVRVGDVFEVGLEVEDAPGMDAALQDIVEELGDVPAHRRYAAAQPDVAEDHGVDRHLDAMRSADGAHGRAGACDRERRRHRLTCTDA